MSFSGSLGSFVLRNEVLKLYRQCVRACNKDVPAQSRGTTWRTWSRLELQQRPVPATHMRVAWPTRAQSDVAPNVRMAYRVVERKRSAMYDNACLQLRAKGTPIPEVHLCPAPVDTIYVAGPALTQACAIRLMKHVRRVHRHLSNVCDHLRR